MVKPKILPFTSHSHRFQRGSILIYGLIALFVVTLAGGMIFAYNRAITEAAEEKQRADTAEHLFHEQKDENERLLARKKVVDGLLAARRTKDNDDADKERQRDAALKKAYSEPEAKKWGATPVPLSILASVRDEAPSGLKDAKGNAAVGVAPANPGSGVAAGDAQLRPPRLRAPAPKAVERL